MKLPKKTKPILIFGSLAFIIYTFFKIIIPPMPLRLREDQKIIPTKQTLSDYLSTLESAALRKGSQLRCDRETAELFKFQDQWQRPLRCKDLDQEIVLSSDGEDKTPDTNDDIILSKVRK